MVSRVDVVICASQEMIFKEGRKMGKLQEKACVSDEQTNRE